MITGPLTDVQIFYKPSRDLVKFIKTLKDGKFEDMPGNVASIARNASAKQKEEVEDCVETAETSEVLTEYPTILQTSDIEYLNSLNLDGEDTDIKIRPAISSDCKPTDKLLTFDDLLWLHKLIEHQNESKDMKNPIYFHTLFQGTEIILPKNEQIPRNEELEARCVKLRNQQKNQEYKQMTKNVDCTRQHMPEDTISYQMKNINQQLIAVFQFVVSVLTGFIFGFMGIELMVGTLDFGFRLLLGIICALTIALAELYFLAKKLNENLDDTYKSTAISSHHHNSKVKCE